jgi:hypothetical protein
MDACEHGIQRIKQLFFRQPSCGNKALLMFEQFNENKSGTEEKIAAFDQKCFPNPGILTYERGEKDVGINDYRRAHRHSRPFRRDWFCDHQSDLISSESFKAVSGVRELRRAAASTRSQLTKALTASAGIPSVGMLTTILFFPASTAITRQSSHFLPGNQG